VKYILFVHLAATLFMVGVIWLMQVVHYPLFARIGQEGFALYSRAHEYLASNWMRTIAWSARGMLVL
jgi:hypothetical protein